MPAPIRLISSDLDGTLIGEREASARFAASWGALPPATRPFLVYNTGRTVADTLAVVRDRGLPAPDFVLGSLGTESYGATAAIGDIRHEFRDGWDLEAVFRVVGAFGAASPQPPEFLNPFKASWYWARASQSQLEEVQARLAAARLSVLVVYSCRRFLDVVPILAGKGNALMWLCRCLGVASTEVLVAGDSGNDEAMFRIPGVRGVLVGNSEPELRAIARGRGMFAAASQTADGVLEGMRHFGVMAPAVGRGPVSNGLSEPAARDRAAAEA